MALAELAVVLPPQPAITAANSIAMNHKSGLVMPSIFFISFS
jgi:hypothetical protein